MSRILDLSNQKLSSLNKLTDYAGKITELNVDNNQLTYLPGIGQYFG